MHIEYFSLSPKVLHSARTVYVYDLYGSQNK